MQLQQLAYFVTVFVAAPLAGRVWRRLRAPPRPASGAAKQGSGDAHHRSNSAAITLIEPSTATTSLIMCPSICFGNDW